MQSKFLKIALAWIGAFFCMWLFGNHMLDVSFIPPPFFFFVALLYTAVTFAKDKEDFHGNKISVFENVFVKIIITWFIAFFIVLRFKFITSTFLIGIVLFIALIYLPILFWGYKYIVEREKIKSKMVLKVLAIITYFAFIIALYYASFATFDSTGIQTIPFNVRFQQGVITCIIFYFLMRYILFCKVFTYDDKILFNGRWLMLLLVYYVGPAIFICFMAKAISVM